MTKFTATQLKNKLGDVLNAVQKHSRAIITSKSRPDFIIVELSEWNNMVQDRDNLLAQLEDAEKHTAEQQAIIDGFYK